MDESLLVFTFSILGTIPILFVGQKYLSDSLQLMLEAPLKKTLKSMRDTPFWSIFSGLVVSTVVQSPISVSNVGVSYGNSGLFSRRQLTYFLLLSGLPIGLTLWLLAYQWGWYELIILGVGAFPAFFINRRRAIAIGKLLVGLGLLLLGSRLMGVGLKSQIHLSLIFEQMNWSQVQGLFVCGVLAVGALGTFITRSLLFILVVILNLFSAEFIGERTMFLLLVGANLGLIAPPFLDWKDLNTKCRRGIFFHLFSRTVFSGFLVFVISEFELYQLVPFSLLAPQVSAWQITISLLYFIFSLTLWLPLNKIVDHLVPRPEIKEFQRLQFIGNPRNTAPVLLIEQAYQEFKKMAAMVESILELTKEVVGTWDLKSETSEKILKYEGVTDRLQREMNNFLSQLIGLELTFDQARQVRSVLRMTKELESIADCCKAIFFLQKRQIDRGVFPPKELRPKISSHFTKLVESYELLFADITDEEGGVFKNKELVAHFELKKENFNNEHSLLIGETSEHPVTCEILFRMDQIGAHTMNIFQAYITVDF